MLMPNDFRRFHLNRLEDATGTSGLGVVAHGCEFSNGWCALVWDTAVASIGFYPSIEAVKTIHGHDGKTRVEFYA